ncbi:LysR family transcriptional regulator [Kushneria aurantia]|uniref:LysR family transcriptional regulator n=1 Tax=Kushneria aurantia TaxID=504092 RepID=A0ABV6G2K1_9GAMM|nr:LysR family transcriptional regulator [Kushneria aurantia]
MTLNQLRLLVALADTGSLSHAARQLEMTQSGASQSLAALEAHLGVQLVTRQRRGVVMTRPGDDVLDEARRIIAGLASIHRITDAARGVEHGRLRLACLPSVSARLLPSLLKTFARRHPGIQVVSIEGTDDEVAGWLAEGRVDIGVVCDAGLPPGGVALCRDEWVAVVPSSHRWVRQRRSGVALSALVAEPFILATGGCSSNARSLVEAQGLALQHVQLEVRDWGSALTLVGEGLGVALVPALHLPRERRGWRMVALEQPLYRQLGLAVATGSEAIPGVRLLLDTAAMLFDDAVEQTSAGQKALPNDDG